MATTPQRRDKKVPDLPGKVVDLDNPEELKGLLGKQVVFAKRRGEPVTGKVERVICDRIHVDGKVHQLYTIQALHIME